MKKMISLLLVLLLVLSAAACGKKESGSEETTTAAPATTTTATTTTETTTEEATEESTADPANLILLQANIMGIDGQITHALPGETIEFDDEYPMQSIVVNVEKGTEVTFAAKPNEGFKFYHWTVNGKDYSKEEQITVKAEEPMEFIANFVTEDTDLTPVDLTKVETLGQVINRPEISSSVGEDRAIFAFEQEDVIYRAIAESSPEVMNAIFELDFDSPDYNKKWKEILSPLKVQKIENLTEMIPAQEELDKLVGKTGEDLFNDGWTTGSGYNLEDMIVYMNHGPFSFAVTFDGTVENPETFNEEEDIKTMTVTAVAYEGIGDAAYMDE